MDRTTKVGKKRPAGDVPIPIPSPATSNIEPWNKQTEFSQNWKTLQKELRDDAAQSQSLLTSEEFTMVVSKKARKLKRKADFHQRLRENAGDKMARLELVPPTEMDTAVERVGRDPPDPLSSRVLALDCEYVGGGDDGRTNILARVSLVDSQLTCIYDKFVKPTEKVTDYRTPVSGIRPPLLVNGEDFTKIQQEVNKLLAGRIVVGHALHNDFKVLNLSHSRRDTRDTAKWQHLRVLAQARTTPSLKMLAEKILGIAIQRGEHDSISDARVAMQIYAMHKKKWEGEVRRNWKKK